MSATFSSFDASRSLTALEQDSTIIAVIEMRPNEVAGLRRWFPASNVNLLRSSMAQEEMLLKLLHRWRREAGQAGRNIERIVVAFEAGPRRVLASALAAGGADVEAYVIHPTSIAVVARTPARKDRSSRYGTSNARLSRLAAWRKAPLQHGGNPDDRGGGREATEP